MTPRTPERQIETARFLTTEDVLGCLKVNARTLYRLIRSGELPAVRIGRQWRIRQSDFEAWLERQRPRLG
jgi:excisionase family DNA binding protein